jgi:aminotransferase
MIQNRVSRKASRFTESVIREMTRLASQHDALNLAQGFPDFPAPKWLKESACRAIQQDINQYSITWGSRRLRQAISQKYLDHYGMTIDPEEEITVACGSTESMISTLLGILDPGDKVLVFEPFYENYGPDAVIAGAQPVYVQLRPELGWTYDPDDLESKIRREAESGGVKALILNSPQNPTGKVFRSHELEHLADLANQYDFYVITDEIYEHIIYDSLPHTPIASIPGMRDRTITISGLSKTFSVTGWRIGYILAPPDVTAAVRKMHDFLTVGAAAPLQEAGAEALASTSNYYEGLTFSYTARRDYFVPALKELGFEVDLPEGAYYVMADIRDLTDETGVQFVERLIREFGVAAVPGSSFYHQPPDGEHLVRFAFCKSMGLLEEAAERLRGLNSQ